ncbi:hypothetical protein ABTX85_31980 [Streptomyces sp. NPDC096097]|uniref:hypothetical protein n=1 Tax=Streptomyces sp. NPDC096097 TaxID=3155546 RepID=UPI0033231AC5
MQRRTKWLIALAGLAAVTMATATAMWVDAAVQEFIRDNGTTPRSTGCERAMTAIGWSMPAHADEGACVEDPSGIFPSQWSGTFRMPRPEVREWLGTHPPKRFPDQRPDEGPVDDKNGIHINLSYLKSPNFGQGDLDAVVVKAEWEGEDTAVVTFETYPG